MPFAGRAMPDAMRRRGDAGHRQKRSEEKRNSETNHISYLPRVWVSGKGRVVAPAVAGRRAQDAGGSPAAIMAPPHLRVMALGDGVARIVGITEQAEYLLLLGSGLEPLLDLADRGGLRGGWGELGHGWGISTA